jgi:hypothetical protein
MAGSVASADQKDGHQFSLVNILGDHHELLEHPGVDSEDAVANGWDEEPMTQPTAEGFCIECEGCGLSFTCRLILTCCADQPAQLLCEVCTDIFCEVCFAALHRKGVRKNHQAKPLGDRIESNGKLGYHANGNINGQAKDAVNGFHRVLD